jgi:hypothetical protein
VLTILLFGIVPISLLAFSHNFKFVVTPPGATVRVGGAITVTLTVKLYGPSLESLLGSITVPVNVPVVVAGKVMLKLVTEPLLN